MAFISIVRGFRKKNDILLHLHPLNPIISLRRSWSSPLFKGPSIKLLKGPLSNHSSNQKDSLLSLLANNFVLLVKTSFPFLMAAKVKKQDLGEVRWL